MQAIRTLVTISIVLFVLLLLMVLAVVIYIIKQKRTEEKLLKSSKRGSDLVYELLRVASPTGRIFRRVLLPYKENGNVTRIPVELLLVDRGGVFVIRTQNMTGRVDNSDREVWTLFPPKGEAVNFPNPIEQNRLPVKAVEALLRRAGVDNIPRYNLVVFTGKRVLFRRRSDRLVTAEQLCETIRDTNRNRFLSQKEINQTVSALRRVMATPKKKA